MEKQKQLEQVVEWAKIAGEMAVTISHEDMQVQLKGRSDLVTRADIEIETFLVSQIKRVYPTHSIVGEEGGQRPGADDYRWFIDPIDGTSSYAHGLPHYCISIALARGDELQMGIIYNPPMNECFTAIRGEGAWLNGKPIHVSACAHLEDALLATGIRASQLDTAQSNLPNFVRFLREAQTVRSLGSAALDMAYLACGRIDGIWRFNLNAWDLAAGVLLVREAGARIETLFEEKSFLEGKTDLLAANPLLFPQMLEILHRERPA